MEIRPIFALPGIASAWLLVYNFSRFPFGLGNIFCELPRSHFKTRVGEFPPKFEIALIGYSGA